MSSFVRLLFECCAVKQVFEDAKLSLEEKKARGLEMYKVGVNAMAVSHMPLRSLVAGLVDSKSMLVSRFSQEYYRKTWSQPDVRRVTSNVQHIMLWDDHELDNDWVGGRVLFSSANAAHVSVCMRLGHLPAPLGSEGH